MHIMLPHSPAPQTPDRQGLRENQICLYQVKCSLCLKYPDH